MSVQSSPYPSPPPVDFKRAYQDSLRALGESQAREAAARQEAEEAKAELSEVIAGLVGTLGPPSGKDWRESLRQLAAEPRDTELAEVRAALGAAQEALTAASHALRSYQYGNSARDLAKDTADHIDAVLSASPTSRDS